MKFPRQPTIRTWFLFCLLLVASLAVTNPLISAFSIDCSPAVFAIAATEPLIVAAFVAMCNRRIFRAGAICFGVRVIWFAGLAGLVVWMDSPQEYPGWFSFVAYPLWPEILLDYFLELPLDLFLRYWYMHLLIAGFVGSLYAFLAVLLASTCRLRDRFTNAPQSNSEFGLAIGPRRRRWKTLAVAALLSAMVVVTSVTAKRTINQKWAVERIRGTGGDVHYWGPAGRISRLPKLEWLADLYMDVYWVQWPATAHPTDKDIAVVQGLPHLQYLWLERSGLTDEGLKQLRDLTELRDLYLGDASISDVGLKQIEGLTNLEELVISNGCRITDNGLTYLERLSLLSDLQIKGAKVTDAGLLHLRPHTRLHRLSLPGAQITDAGLKHLQHLTALSTLELSGAAITNAGLSQIQSFTKLDSLALDDTDITDAGVSLLFVFPELRQLSLGPNITDVGFTDLTRFTKLERLGLRGTKITDAGLVTLQSFPQLRELSLGPEITNAGLIHLSTLRELWRLDLGETQVNDEGLIELQRLPWLSEIHLGKEISDAGLVNLEKMVWLQRIVFTRDRTTADGRQKFISEFSFLRTIEFDESESK